MSLSGPPLYGEDAFFRIFERVCGSIPDWADTPMGSPTDSVASEAFELDLPPPQMSLEQEEFPHPDDPHFARIILDMLRARAEFIRSTVPYRNGQHRLHGPPPPWASSLYPPSLRSVPRTFESDGLERPVVTPQWVPWGDNPFWVDEDFAEDAPTHSDDP
jgi:hypothetical protein